MHTVTVAAAVCDLTIQAANVYRAQDLYNFLHPHLVGLIPLLCR